MARYTYTGTGKAHIITEWDADADRAETACGLTLQHIHGTPLETDPDDRGSYPRDRGEWCGNCPWEDVVADELGDD